MQFDNTEIESVYEIENVARMCAHKVKDKLVFHNKYVLVELGTVSE